MKRYMIIKQHGWYKIKVLTDVVEIFNLILDGVKIYDDIKQAQNVCDIENMGID